MEANGNICVATIGECGISVVSPAGELVEFVATDDIFTTNIAFGGADMRDAYLTLSGSGRLVKTRWARPGLALPSCAGGHGNDPPRGPRRPAPRLAARRDPWRPRRHRHNKTEK